MRILFNHCNYPAQFRRLAPALAADGHDVHFLFKDHEWHAPPADGVVLHRYPAVGQRNQASVHPYLRKFDEAVAEGQNSYRAARELLRSGWKPDVIISHAGFGNGLYLQDLFPQAKRIGLFEWFYKADGSDVDFLQHGIVAEDQRLRLRTWNAQLMLELIQCDAAVCPTAWQRQQFPTKLQKDISLIHEGIDCQSLHKLRQNTSSRPNWLPSEGKQIISYVSRGFEQYRGFPQAMQALAEVQAKKPNTHVVIAGSDIVCYGSNRDDGRSWQQWAEADSGLDPLRTNWLGPISTDQYHSLLKHTDAHLYLTIPFILSWSLLEAMAAGCPIVSSATAPVQEVMSNDHDGLLADFWTPSQIADRLIEILTSKDLSIRIGAQAQRTAQLYDAREGLSLWKELISNLA